LGGSKAGEGNPEGTLNSLQKGGSTAKTGRIWEGGLGRLSKQGRRVYGKMVKQAATPDSGGALKGREECREKKPNGNRRESAVFQEQGRKGQR